MAASKLRSTERTMRFERSLRRSRKASCALIFETKAKPLSRCHPSREDSKFAMTESAVVVHGLTKVFPVSFKRKPVVAVRDLNLRVEAGQIYGLLGPNGSGKSTTLKIILGLVSPTRGKTEIFGSDSRLVKSRESVGFLPENPYFYKFLTGTEPLRFY